MYYSQIRVDPSNPENVFVGGLNFSKSTDGGKKLPRCNRELRTAIITRSGSIQRMATTS